MMTSSNALNPQGTDSRKGEGPHTGTNRSGCAGAGEAGVALPRLQPIVRRSLNLLAAGESGDSAARRRSKPRRRARFEGPSDQTSPFLRQAHLTVVLHADHISKTLHDLCARRPPLRGV